MNNNYYTNPLYNNTPQTELPENYNKLSQNPYPLLSEQLYIDNILSLNTGKKAKIHATFPNSIKWQDNTFEGIIESTEKDHIIISNPNTGKWYLIPIIYLNYITFEEPIKHI